MGDGGRWAKSRYYRPEQTNENGRVQVLRATSCHSPRMRGSTWSCPGPLYLDLWKERAARSNLLQLRPGHSFLHQSAKIEEPRVRIAPVHSRDPFSSLQCDGKERVRHLGYDLSARNDWSILCHWVALEKWPALQCFYVGVQDPELDSCIPLLKKDYKAFSTAFLKIGNYHNPQPPIPWTPVLARIEWIRAQCIYNSGLKDQSRYDRIREATRLVKIVNTSSL